MTMQTNVVALFPACATPDQARRRHAAALRQCVAAIAEEASGGGFVLTGQALELAIAVLDSEAKPVPAAPPSPSIEPTE